MALKILAVETVVMKWNHRDLWEWNSHCGCWTMWALATRLLFCGSVFVKNLSSRTKTFPSPLSSAPCSLF